MLSLLNEVQVSLRELLEEGDGGGLDCDAVLLLILTGVHEACLPVSSEDACLAQKGIGQCRLAIVQKSDD